MRRFFLGLCLAVLFPYVMALAFGGCIQGIDGFAENGGMIYMQGQGSAGGEGKIYLSGEGKGYVEAESYLTGVVASQMPGAYEKEALKAQAVIARTWLYRQMEAAGSDSLEEKDLNLPALSAEELKSLWGKDNFADYFEKVKEAVAETEGKVLVYEGKLITPLFHRASAGSTRDGGGDYPYLKAVDSSRDVEAEGYLTVTTWTPGEFARLFQEAARKAGQEYVVTEDQIPGSIQLVERDSAGYVAQIQIGSHIYSGEEVQEILNLPSPAFTLENFEGSVRGISRGAGHGLGLSQYGAHCLAGDGMTAEEILKYYYSNIEIQ